MARFHSLKIKDVQRETDDAVSIAFDVPREMNGTFEFVPGQYLTVRTQIDGAPQQRTYSICSGLDDGELRIAVKRVEGGVFSNFANDNLAAGMEIDVMPPLGRFVARPGESSGARYAAFAAGSGVTPIFSIVKTLLEREPDSTFTLFYGKRDRGSVIFREQLEDLKDRFLERFTLVHVLSREGQDVDLLHGRLDADRIAMFARAGLFDPETVSTCLFVRSRHHDRDRPQGPRGSWCAVRPHSLRAVHDRTRGSRRRQTNIRTGQGRRQRRRQDRSGARWCGARVFDGAG